MSLRRLEEDWTDLGDLDPYWAVLTTEEGRFARWDRDAFFCTGQAEIDGLMAAADEFGLPARREAALDFGCGVGRLTRALRRYFPCVTGVDISASMIDHAREVNREVAGCTFVHNTEADLRLFPAGAFDLVYTNIVLQHIPSRRAIKAYLGEFLRTLRPGGLLAFQVPSGLPLRYRLQWRRRAYGLLKALGFGKRFLYRRLGLYPMSLKYVPEQEVRDLLSATGGNVLRVRADGSSGPAIPSRVYYVTR